MLHVMPFMGPDLEINSILFYSILFCYLLVWMTNTAVFAGIIFHTLLSVKAGVHNDNTFNYQYRN